MQRIHRDTNRRCMQRKGLVLLVVLICLLLITTAGGSALKIAVTGHRQTEQEQFRRQATWLADAALGRAAAQLRQDTTYSGEAWNIPADQLGTGYGAASRLSSTIPAGPTGGPA